jgi:hypothetical protein
MRSRIARFAEELALFARSLRDLQKVPAAGGGA